MMRIPPSLLQLLGRSSLAGAVLAALATPFGAYPSHRPLLSYLFMLLLLALVSAGVLVAARLQQRQDPLAARAVPSTLVAYLLLLLMGLRWFSGP